MIPSILTPLEPLIALEQKWRERSQTLLRRADSEPAVMGNYTKSLADRAECYDRCADELAAAVALVSPHAQHEQETTNDLARIGQLDADPPPQHAASDRKGS